MLHCLTDVDRENNRLFIGLAGRFNETQGDRIVSDISNKIKSLNNRFHLVLDMRGFVTSGTVGELNCFRKMMTVIAFKSPGMILRLAESVVFEPVDKIYNELRLFEGHTLINADNREDAVAHLNKNRYSQSMITWFMNCSSDVVFSTPSVNKSKPGTAQQDYGYFKPGQKVEIILNPEAIYPVVRKVMVLKHNKKDRILLLSQPVPEIPESLINQGMEVSILLDGELGEKNRLSTKLQILKFYKNIKITKNRCCNAVVFEYMSSFKESNLRASFRYRLCEQYNVRAVLVYRGKKYDSESGYRLTDISLTGFGIKVGCFNSDDGLSQIEQGDNLRVELRFVRSGEADSSGSVRTFVEVARKNLNESERLADIGFRFCGVDKGYEQTIVKFINEAQSWELRNKMKVT